MKAVTVAVSQSVATVHAEVRVIIFLLRHGIAHFLCTHLFLFNSPNTYKEILLITLRKSDNYVLILLIYG